VAAWLRFAAWSLITFSVLERIIPRHPLGRATFERSNDRAIDRSLGRRRRWRRIGGAIALLGIDALIVRSIVRTSPAPQPVLGLIAAWLVSELAAYWLHRAMHRVPLLWRFHRLHHDGTPVSWSDAWRSHPVDAAAFACTTLLGGLVTGTGAPGAAWIVVGQRAWTVLLHASIAWRRGPLDHAIATPPFHHRHHREDLRPANFASMLPALDRLFGTAA